MGQESFLTISSGGVYDARRMGVKVAVVGGGSTYTPELVEGFVTRTDRLPVDELVLLDIDPARLAIVGALAERMVRAAGWAGSVRLTDRMTEAPEELTEAAPIELVRALGAIPSSYLRYYYRTSDVLEHQRTHRTRAEEVL